MGGGPRNTLTCRPEFVVRSDGWPLTGRMVTVKATGWLSRSIPETLAIRTKLSVSRSPRAHSRSAALPPRGRPRAGSQDPAAPFMPCLWVQEKTDFQGFSFHWWKTGIISSGSQKSCGEERRYSFLFYLILSYLILFYFILFLPNPCFPFPLQCAPPLLLDC